MLLEFNDRLLERYTIGGRLTRASCWPVPRQSGWARSTPAMGEAGGKRSGKGDSVTIPRSPSDITPAWLGAVLGTEVTEVKVTAIGTGQTGATYRVAATYPPTRNHPSRRKLSRSSCPLRTMRSVNGWRWATCPRSSSTLRLPTTSPSRFPAASTREISSEGTDFVLVLADMAPAVQGDQIAGCTQQEAVLAVEALAGLHGPSWGDRRFFDLRVHRHAQTGGRGGRQRHGRGGGHGCRTSHSKSSATGSATRIATR